MTKVLVIAQVKDAAKWEASFRTHGELFRGYSVSKPVSYGMTGGNYVGTCFEAEDLAVFMKSMADPATAAAMEVDGILRETVKVIVLDKELKL